MVISISFQVGRPVKLMVVVNAYCFESMLASCYFLCVYPYQKH